MNKDRITPRFISEGSSPNKRRAINSSRYLGTVHGEVLSDLGDAVVIYGYGFNENDSHILTAMRSKNKPPKKFAISVYMGESKANQQKYCHRVSGLMEEQFRGAEVHFFAHDSPGCWANPPKS